MNKCEKCGFLHYRTDPCRVKKSAAARMDVRNDGGREDRHSRDLTSPIQHKLAGTQALPVDTNIPKPKRKRAKDTRTGDRHTPGYMANYLRDWRAKRRSAEKLAKG